MGKVQRIIKHKTKKTEEKIKKEIKTESASQDKTQKEGDKNRGITCAEARWWSFYGIFCGILLVVAVAAFLIIRLDDERWSSWQLPTIISILYFATISVAALLISFKSVYRNMCVSNKPVAKVKEQEKEAKDVDDQNSVSKE